MEKQELSPSLEDYLEAVLILETQHRVARVKDIAEHLDVRMPSVTSALRNLKERELIKHEKNSFITLTVEGKEIAKEVHEKHHILNCFFSEVMNLPEEKSEEVACAIEHIIDMKVAHKFKKLTEKMISCTDCDHKSELS